MEATEIKNIVDAGFKDLEGKVDTKFQTQFEASKADIVKEIEEKGFLSKDAVDALIKEKTADLESAVIDLKKAGIKTKETEVRSLKSMLKDGMDGVKNGLSDIKNNKSRSASAILFKADEDLDDANWSGDSLAIATTDRSRGLYESPFAPVWFRNLLPQGSTSSTTIEYIKENGDVGAAGVWDGTGAIAELESKPGTAPLFDSVTENVIDIAGITRVKKNMLEDIPWLMGYLARRLTVGRTGLWVAENTQIYNALTTNSTPYGGSKTNPLEIIIDAAFAQLRDNYYTPTTILMSNQDLVNLIVLNKASGSGEYDFPDGVIAVVNGVLSIGGIPVVGAPNVPAGEFLVMDRNATEFVNRMSPVVEFFREDRDNVIKNLVTVRAEERILPLVYDDNAIITGSFTPST